MEPKSGSRLLKKSASGGALGERKKAKQKKKKDKKKLSLKGTESTDVPSPEFDSEVPLDGDATLTDLDGQATPVAGGQVTRLPQLSTSSSVSLTTLNTSTTPPPRLITTTTTTTTSATASVSLAAARAGVGGSHSHGISSAPVSRTSFTVAAPPPQPHPPPHPVPTQGGNLDGVVARVASLNIKQRSTTTTGAKAARSKGQGSKVNKASRGARNNGSKASSVGQASNGKGGQGGSPTSSESMRWELAVEDVEQERERIALYKMNRRKRYLAAAQAKGLGWALNYNTQLSVTPATTPSSTSTTSTNSASNASATSLPAALSEDSGVETATCGSPGAGHTTATSVSSSSGPAAASSSTSSTTSGAYIDFSSMQTLRPIPAHRALQEAFVEC